MKYSYLPGNNIRCITFRFYYAGQLESFLNDKVE